MATRVGRGFSGLRIIAMVQMGALMGAVVVGVNVLI
jgi:hypothetical protein